MMAAPPGVQAHVMIFFVLHTNTIACQYIVAYIQTVRIHQEYSEHARTPLPILDYLVVLYIYLLLHELVK